MIPSLALLLPTAAAATWVAGTDAATVQATVDLASDGDTVEIPAGAWVECVDLGGRDLTLHGAGSGSTSLGEPQGCATTLTAAAAETVTVEGLTIFSGSEHGVVLVDAAATFTDVVVQGDPTWEVTVKAEDQPSASDPATWESPAGGAGVRVEGGSLTWDEGGVFDHWGPAGANMFVADATVSLTAVSIAGGQGSQFVASYTVDAWGDEIAGWIGIAGGIYATRASLDLENSLIEENSAVDYGGGICTTESTTLRSAGTLWQGNSATGSDARGGAVALRSSGPVEFRGDTFEENSSSKRGGAVYACSDSDLEATDITATGNYAPWGGAFYLEGPTSISDSRFESNEGGSGGAIYADAATVTSNGTSYVTNLAESGLGGGGAIYLDDGAVLTSTTDTFTQNVAEGDGGGAFAYLHGGTSATFGGATFQGNTAHRGGALYVWRSAEVSNSSFIENSAESSGGAVTVGTVGTFTSTNSTFLANEAPSGAAIYLDGASLTALNTLVADHEAPAIVSEGTSSATVTYSDFWNNTADTDGSVTVTLGADGNIAADPALRAYTADGVWDDLLWPTPGSPLIDAGDPTLLDPDGSRSDIGAYGGPDAPTVDEDADGSDVRADCDDTDATRSPELPELCGGGDENCDGLTDEPGAEGETAWYADTDGDGHGAGTATLACTTPEGFVATDGDCDDTDAEVWPGAPETADDGVDQDCDGADLVTPADSGDTSAATPVDTGEPPADGCGCSSGTSAPGGLLIGVTALAMRRRRPRLRSEPR